MVTSRDAIKSNRFNDAFYRYGSGLAFHKIIAVVPVDRKSIVHHPPQEELINAIISGETEKVLEWIPGMRFDRLNQADEFGRIPLIIAAEYGRWEIAKAFLARGADVNQVSRFGKTVLHVASEQGHQDIVEMLIENGADMNCKNKDGCTPLIIALQNRCKAVANFLIEKGAIVSIKDNNGNSALTLAPPSNDTDIINAINLSAKIEKCMVVRCYGYIYQGQFKYGLFHGKGKLTNKDGAVL